MNVYGVTFKDGGRVYYFNGHTLAISNNVTVIVETEKGLQFGKVVKKASAKEISEIKDTLKDILRIASHEDYEQYLKNLKDAKKALEMARNYAKDLNLNMRILDATFTFDRKQLLFNFCADERIDFRELAKKLAGVYRTRIELRQIGARDKAESVGGIGPCGRELCCSSFLNHLESVTMNMAKNQNIALNPAKINGCCGRLLCCLAYEDDVYNELQKNIPSIGQTVETGYGKGSVVSIDVLRQCYKVDIDGEIHDIFLNDERSN